MAVGVYGLGVLTTGISDHLPMFIAMLSAATLLLALRIRSMSPKLNVSMGAGRKYVNLPNNSMMRVVRNRRNHVTIWSSDGQPSDLDALQAATVNRLDSLKDTLSAGGSAVGRGAHDALFARRSVAKFDKQRTVSDEVLQRAIDAAILAPNHFITEPWRFYDAGPDALSRLVGMNEDKKALFEGVPRWMVVTVVKDPEAPAKSPLATKKGQEDYAATAAAVQNLMLSFAADGVGSKWMTGALGVGPEVVLQTAGIDANTEMLVGVIWYGFPQKTLAVDAKAPPRKLGRGAFSTLG